MSKTAKAGIAGLLAIVVVQGFYLRAVLAVPEVRQRLDYLQYKLTGKAPHVRWAEMLWVLTPSRFRQSWMPQVQLPTEYLRIPVRPIKRESGPCSTQWETPLGAFWAKPDEGGLLSHLVNEELNEAVYNRPPVAIRAGDVVVDGGAHVGTFSKFALAHGARRVIAFEPDPINADCLQRNLDSELRSGAVVVVRKALWNRSGALALSRGENSAQSIASDSVKAPTGESIPATTIDETVRDLGLDRVDFMKLDIEGAESKAIEGAAETLRRFRPRMVLCTYHSPDDPVKITEAVMRARPSYWIFASGKHAYFYEGEGEASRRDR